VLVRRCATLLLLAALFGCQTARSFDQGCGGIYSGVRYYADQVAEVPFDGKLFFTIDLPITAVFDTLLTPFTWAIDRERPSRGWPVGCRWADQ
jgi:uncharacterized protein YceK